MEDDNSPPWEEEIMTFKAPELNLEAVRYGLCIDRHGARRRMRHAIADDAIAAALRPIVASPLRLRVPSLRDEVPTVPLRGGAIQLPSEVAVEVARFLGDVDDLDALAAASAPLRAVARGRRATESLRDAWLPPPSSSSVAARRRLGGICPRSLSRTFRRVEAAAAAGAAPGGWDAVLWQASALGCVHGIIFGLGRGANVDGYSGGRQNREGPALWAAAKLNHLDAVRWLCEEGGADVEARGGIRTCSTPLWVAAREGNSRVMKYLISIGADTASRSHNGRSRLTVRSMVASAIRKEHGLLPEMMEIFNDDSLW